MKRIDATEVDIAQSRGLLSINVIHKLFFAVVSMCFFVGSAHSGEPQLYVFACVVVCAE